MQESDSIQSGDRVRLLRVQRELARVPEETRRVFDLWVGGEFIVVGFDSYGHAEPDVNSTVDETVGTTGNSIWVEIEYLEKVTAAD